MRFVAEILGRPDFRSQNNSETARCFSLFHAVFAREDPISQIPYPGFSANSSGIDDELRIIDLAHASVFVNSISRAVVSQFEL